MAKQLLGKEVTDALNAKLIERANALKEKGVVPTLGIVRVGENPSDLSYEKGATKRAELIGINVQKFVLPEDASKEDLLKLIDEINANDAIHGVLMFRPLPKHLKADQNEICNRLDPKKDVDCMTDLSNAGVFEGRSDLGFAPCTPAACMEILDYYGIDCKGKNAVVIGRSLVVGKPAAMMLMGKNATVTVCHTKTVNTAEVCRKADILVSAAGVLNSLTKDYFRPGQVVIDEQDIAAHPHAKRQPAAEIALRRAAVAVKQQEPRRVRGCGIAAAEQRQSVVRADRYRLIGKGEGRADHAPRLRRIRPVLVRVRQDEHFLFGRFPRAERQPEQQKRQPERQEHKARCDQQRDANVLHSRAPIHRPRMLMTPCRAKLASAHGAASSMTARQSASSRLRAAMRSHCPRETGVTPK